MGKIHNVLEKKGLSSEVIKTSYRPLFNNNDFDDAYVSTSIRELAHKVDILLYIVKGMAQCPNEIYHLADINNSSPRKTIDFFTSGLADSILRVIGKKKTLVATSAFSQKLTSIYSEISLERNKIAKKYSEIDRLSHLIEDSFVEQGYLAELICQSNSVNNGKRNILNRLIKELTYKKNRLKDNERNMQKLMSSQNRDLFYLNKLCILKVEEISVFIVDVVFAFREELTLLPETERYFKKGSNIINSIKANIDFFYNDLDDVFRPIFEIAQSDNKIFRETLSEISNGKKLLATPIMKSHRK